MERYRPDRFHVRSATSRRANCSCCCISLRVREAAAPEIRMRPSSPRSAPSSTQRNRWEGQSGSGEAAMWDSSRGVFIGNGPERRHYHYHPPQRMEDLWTNTKYFKQGLTSAGFNTGISETP